MNRDNEPGAEVKSKLGPHEVSADLIHKTISEVRSQVQCIFEMQIQINEKLVNPPDDTPDTKKETQVDAPVNPRHLPGFRDSLGDISRVLQVTQRLQEFLLKHL